MLALLAAGSAACAEPAPQPAVVAARPESLTIVARPLPANCSGARPAGAVVDVAVIHFSSNVVARPDDPFRVDEVLALFARQRVSAHYLVARDGQVLRLVDDARRAFHAGRGSYPYDRARDNRLNDTSIGIELMAIGSERDMRPFLSAAAYARIAPADIGFTDAQYASLRRLLANLNARHPRLALDRRHVIGHDEYAPGRKTDPGERFEWERLGLMAAR